MIYGIETSIFNAYTILDTDTSKMWITARNDKDFSSTQGVLNISGKDSHFYKFKLLSGVDLINLRNYEFCYVLLDNKRVLIQFDCLWDKAIQIKFISVFNLFKSSQVLSKIYSSDSYLYVIGVSGMFAYYLCMLKNVGDCDGIIEAFRNIFKGYTDIRIDLGDKDGK